MSMRPRRCGTVLLCATYFAVTIGLNPMIADQRLRPHPGGTVGGDTIEATLRQFPSQAWSGRVRVLGVNTPEKKGATLAAARAAEAFTRAWLAEPGTPPLTIRACAFDSLSRLLGRVCRDWGECLDEALIRAGHGVAR